MTENGTQMGRTPPDGTSLKRGLSVKDTAAFRSVKEKEAGADPKKSSILKTESSFLNKNEKR